MGHCVPFTGFFIMFMLFLVVVGCGGVYICYLYDEINAIKVKVKGGFFRDGCTYFPEDLCHLEPLEADTSEDLAEKWRVADRLVGRAEELRKRLDKALEEAVRVR